MAVKVFIYVVARTTLTSTDVSEEHTNLKLIVVTFFWLPSLFPGFVVLVAVTMNAAFLGAT
jgi:hypothetical protein